MQLKSFHVRVFRNIIDSGPVDVNDVTCIVGKNEAGKSALLEALHRLNPARPAATFDVLNDYPRWLKKEHEITGDIETAVPITAYFELTDEELSELEDAYGTGILHSKTFSASRKYGSDLLFLRLAINYNEFLDPFLDSSPEKLRRLLGKPENTTTLREQLNAIAARTGDDEELALASDARADIARLDRELGEGRGIKSAIESRIRSSLPRTFYFSRYAELAGRYHFDEVFQAIENGSEDESIQTAADFLQLARISPDSAGNWDFEESNAELESVSSLLTKRVTQQWKQNSNLRLRVSIESKQGTAPNGTPKIDRFLQLRVEDTRHDFSNRLDRRSTGFRWFVSFIASFLEFEKDQSLILLLDEPGLSLHARAQMDLLDTIDTSLAQNRQVIYTAHSPFMVRPQGLSDTRIIEDKGPESGSTVTNDAGMVSDSDTLFPLQAALGYDIAHSLFIGNQNVLVEGVSDYIYLTMISQHLSAAGREHFGEQVRLLPAGGASNIPTFIALIGTQLDVVVLLDGNTPRQRIDSTIARGRLQQSKIIDISLFCTTKEADIEDLFTDEEYVTLYNGTHGTRLKASSLTGSDRIVNRIARERGKFDHGEVAAYFLRHIGKTLGSLSEETLERFESVIRAINSALP